MGADYDDFVREDPCGYGEYENREEVLDKYIKELDSNYKSVDISTDFRFYVDDEVKVFAKELKKYANTTLEYVGIMPQKQNLDEYIKSINASKLNSLISNLKSVTLDNATKGKVTQIHAFIPLFKYDYQLNLMDDLKTMGITDIFESSKANLKDITKEKGVFIDNAVHKANIEFSNEGIKAVASTTTGGGEMILVVVMIIYLMFPLRKLI